MQIKFKRLTRSDVVRWAMFWACQIFSLVSTVYFAVKGNSGKAFMSGLSILYICVPNILEKLFKFRIQTPLYIFVIFYTICPMIGYAYNLYYLVSWWDDILHAFAGVVFAMFGAYLPKVLNKGKPCSVVLCALFGFVFSMAVAAAWECIEFSLDTFFGTDMQKDTVVYNIRSYLLGEWTDLPVSEMAEWNVNQVVVNGTELQGYIDIGLIDSMKDIFVETAGAIVYTVIFVAGKGKRFVFEPIESLSEEQTEAQPLPLPEPTDSPEQEAAISISEDSEN